MKQGKPDNAIAEWSGPGRWLGPKFRQATHRYRQAVQAGSVRARADGDKAAQVAHYAKAQGVAACVDIQVRQVLCEAGIPPAMFLYYFSFSRQVAKLVRGFSYMTLRNSLPGLVERWVSRGLRRDVLVRICYDVFTISDAVLESPNGSGESPNE